MTDTLEMLQELLAQDQFELLLEEEQGEKQEEEQSEGQKNRSIRFVYLMNDAVESFLVFRNASMTGRYDAGYEGELEATLSKEESRYVLSVWQGDHVVTVFFEQLDLEVHLYRYHEIGHFWVKGFEDFRCLEYQIAILRDKYQYLGAAYCTEGEKKLASLAAFPPLNACCYPAVPAKYFVLDEQSWIPSKKALAVMKELAQKANDKGLLWLLAVYERIPYPLVARWIARCLRFKKHRVILDCIKKELRDATKYYKNREFEPDISGKLDALLKKAEKRKQELEAQGIQAEIYREEPFTTARDSITLHAYVMSWKKGLLKNKVMIETIEE